MFEQVDNVVGFSKIILYVVIFGRDAELDKLVLKGATLFKKKMNFALDFHFRYSPLSVIYNFRSVPRFTHLSPVCASCG